MWYLFTNNSILSLGQGTEIIKTNLKLNVFGVKLDSFFYHSYFPSLSSLTWTLDYTKKSSFGECNRPGNRRRFRWLMELKISLCVLFCVNFCGYPLTHEPSVFFFFRGVGVASRCGVVCAPRRIKCVRYRERERGNDRVKAHHSGRFFGICGWRAPPGGGRGGRRGFLVVALFYPCVATPVCVRRERDWAGRF